MSDKIKVPDGVEVWIGDGPDAVAEEAARRFVVACEQAIAARGRFTVALAGGSTPKGTYRRLAAAPWRERVDWKKVDVFFGDERTVPPDHADSNYRMAREALLDAVPLDPARVHRIEGERDPDAAARDYEAALRRALGVEAGPVPLDLVLLGMGPDGHTASLFPHTAALAERTRLVAPNRVEKLSTWRVTMTYPQLDAAREIVFLIAGAEKAPVLQSLDAREHPMLGVRPTAGRLAWLLDRAAAGVA